MQRKFGQKKCSERKLYLLIIPSGIDTDADLMLFCGVEQAAPTGRDAIAADGDIADLTLRQDLQLSTSCPIGGYHDLQLVAVGSWNRVDLKTLLIMMQRVPLLLLRFHHTYNPLPPLLLPDYRHRGRYQ